MITILRNPQKQKKAGNATVDHISGPAAGGKPVIAKNKKEKRQKTAQEYLAAANASARIVADGFVEILKLYRKLDEVFADPLIDTHIKAVQKFFVTRDRRNLSIKLLDKYTSLEAYIYGECGGINKSTFYRALYRAHHPLLGNGEEKKETKSQKEVERIEAANSDTPPEDALNGEDVNSETPDETPEEETPKAKRQTEALRKEKLIAEESAARAVATDIRAVLLLSELNSLIALLKTHDADLPAEIKRYLQEVPARIAAIEKKATSE
ncbi:MAG: hypothetical protein WCE53_06460 [Candidatus Acidiferrum sp.]